MRCQVLTAVKVPEVTCTRVITHKSLPLRLWVVREVISLVQKCAHGFALGRVVGVMSPLLWCCVNNKKNLCREEIYAATTQGKISLQDLPRVKTVNKILPQ